MRRPSRQNLARAGMLAALVGLELYLAGSMSATPSIRGYVDIKSYGVSSSTKGLVRKLDVALGESVTQGQVIAEMDPGSLDDELAVQLAERKRILGARGSGDANEDLRAIDTRLEQLQFQRDSMRLKAPVDGIVESIDVRPGDAVGPNSPVATVVARDTRRVIACIPESRVDEVDVGRATEVQTIVGGHAFTGVVESVTPAIAALPPRCQPPLGRIPIVGRIAVVLLDDSADLLPGQTELIAFGSEHRAVPALAAQSATSARPPQLLDVPPGIGRFEPSGLAWVASLDRYIIVSDETGTDAHRPWLYAMSRRGVIDPEPIVVEGSSGFDDLESIAAGDSGALWLAASQSTSEKGNRPKQREHLMRIVPAAGGFRVDGKVRLAQLLDAAPGSVRDALGVPDTRALDIEGLAWRGGALYLGVKAPVDDRGRAMIWRVAAPDKLLAGDLAGAGVEVWGRIPLVVERDGRNVPGGIADMVFTSDTSLIVTATASGLSGKRQTGALVVVHRTNGELHPTVVETFASLRPEGIAIGPDPHRIAIVFDRGHDTPMWVERDLPTGGEDL